MLNIKFDIWAKAIEQKFYTLNTISKDHQRTNKSI